MNWRLALLIFCLALPGCFVMAYFAIPKLINANPPEMSISDLQAATFIQSAISSFLSASAGTLLYQKVGFRLPVISALMTSGNVFSELRVLVMPGIYGGFLGAIIIVAFHYFAPDQLSAIFEQTLLPIFVRVLYGGITEEILMRWGMMTFIAWACWKLVDQQSSKPTSTQIKIAIVMTAFIFGLSHIPVASAVIGTMTVTVGAYIVLGNTIFGLIAGWLFWRYGLEVAIFAHTVAHVLAFFVLG